VDSSKNKIVKSIYQAKNFLASFVFSGVGKITDIFKNKETQTLNFKQNELDRKLIYSLTKSKIPSLKQIKYLGRYLSRKESWLIKLCLLIIFSNIFYLGYGFYKNHLQIVPVAGGNYTEGLVGSPKYINPLYAVANDVDSDISRLVFSSLFGRNENGELINDLVDNYAISDDNKSYTIIIKDNAKWTNGDKVTVDDVIFTFQAINNPTYKSPLRAGFFGVSVEKIDDKTIKFNLSEPYAAFLELLTFGIIPENMLLAISPESANLAELNLKPIGSGPYKFKSLTKDKSGNIRGYNLTVNEDYYGQEPYIENINFKFFANFNEAILALNQNQINGISYLPINMKSELVSQDSLSFYRLNIPQITAIFFNQKNNPALADKKVRQALAFALNRSEIVSEIFLEEAYVIDGPISPNNFAYNKDIKKYKFNLEEAEKLLTEAGWVKTEITVADIEKATVDQASEDKKIKDEAEAKLEAGQGFRRKKSNEYLTINLTTVETSNNIKTVEMAKVFWEKAGVKTNLNIVPVAEIQTEVIKPKKFEALFYGQVIGNDPDSYTFWHSSQAGEGGLNIANYSNKDVDQLLEDARLISDKGQRIEKYKKFQEILGEDVPAIFMYSPFYTYVQSKSVKGFAVKSILAPCDRFSDVPGWCVKTGKKIIW